MMTIRKIILDKRVSTEVLLWAFGSTFDFHETFESMISVDYRSTIEATIWTWMRGQYAFSLSKIAKTRDNLRIPLLFGRIVTLVMLMCQPSTSVEVDGIVLSVAKA